MKTIAVTGGKGGTGKSTVAVLLAAKLAKRGPVLLVDLDVECPNDYLLTGGSLKNPVQTIEVFQPQIDKSLCQKCGKCVAACTSHALFMPTAQEPQLISDLCSGCQTCWDVCPYQAITSTREQTGQIFRQEVGRNVTLVTGRANPGIIETSPIVREAKNFALEIARQEKFDQVVIDTAAGTHCPTLVALMGVDLAIAVTEPTPMGAHDLDLILQVLQRIKVKFEIYLNQYNLGDKERVFSVLKKYGRSAFDCQIPYSKEIAIAYNRGNLLATNFENLKI